MRIEAQEIQGKALNWTLRCPTKEDAAQLSRLRVQIDSETEYLDREPGENYLSPEDFKKLIITDGKAATSLFLLAEVQGKIVGYTRCQGNTLTRFRHKAELGLCVSKDYWGCGIGRTLLEIVLLWAKKAGLMKITLTVVQTNTTALDLYMKLGFAQEGVLVSDRRHKDGEFYNTVLMGKFVD